MSTKVSELTTDEFKSLIAATVSETMENFIEDMEAIASKEFVQSVEESRNDYRAGRTLSMEQVFGKS